MLENCRKTISTAEYLREHQTQTHSRQDHFHRRHLRSSRGQSLKHFAPVVTDNKATNSTMNAEITASLAVNPSRKANIHSGAISMMRPRLMMKATMKRYLILACYRVVGLLPPQSEQAEARRMIEQGPKRAIWWSGHQREKIRSAVDIVCFFSRDCISIVVEPGFETADVCLWHRWPCSDLGMLNNEFIRRTIVNICLVEEPKRECISSAYGSAVHSSKQLQSRIGPHQSAKERIQD